MNEQAIANDSTSRPKGIPGATSALILLILINLFNYIDRQVLAGVERDIRLDLLPDDPRALAKMGYLVFAFMVTYMILAPLFGWLGDRMSRWMLIGVGVILWSLASGASGLANTFLILFLTRCLVGVGEAAYGPVAPTLISDMYPVEVRGKVMAWFYAAIPVGSALGYVLGGQVSKAWSWHWAFFLVVPPGILLGLLCFLYRDPDRGRADDITTPQRKPQFRDYTILLHIPSYLLVTAGMTAMTFAMGGLGFWMKEFLAQHGAEPWLGLEPITIFGGMTALAGLLATLIGGAVGDWLRRFFPSSYFLVSASAMLIGFPVVLLVVWTPFPDAWWFVFLAVFCLFFNTGPSNTIIANVTPTGDSLHRLRGQHLHHPRARRCHLSVADR
ncbi:MAG: MFS transporter [Gemmatales bacterium]|nr:MAG: MFS transporter [Gemmatales bacterium]